MGSIAYTLISLFILLSPVSAGGYAFDTATCSPAAIAFLTVQMKRAVTTCTNAAAVLNGDNIPEAIMDPIVFMTGETDPISSILAVFGGGQISNQLGQTVQIAGIASYTDLLSNYDSTNSAAVNAADVEGNLVFA